MKSIDFETVDHQAMQALHEEEAIILHDLLSALQKKDADITAINSLIDQFIKHTEQHFSYEENLMIKAGFPPYPAHASEHRNALDQLQDYHSQWQTHLSPADLYKQLHEAYLPWLKRHVQTMDYLTAQFVNRYSTV